MAGKGEGGGVDFFIGAGGMDKGLARNWMREWVFVRRSGFGFVEGKDRDWEGNMIFRRSSEED